MDMWVPHQKKKKKKIKVKNLKEEKLRNGHRLLKKKISFSIFFSSFNSFSDSRVSNRQNSSG